VKLITLRNSKGMSAQILTYGAIIKELQAPDRDGKFSNVVLTTDTLEKYQRFNGAAAVIGRVVNRIAGAQFELTARPTNSRRTNGKTPFTVGARVSPSPCGRSKRHPPRMASRR
jgi:aldose 1-epimerase